MYTVVAETSDILIKTYIAIKYKKKLYGICI